MSEKIWVVELGVPNIELEQKLNELAEGGFQIFKVDRYEETRASGCGLEVLYDVVAFNPTRMAQKSSEAMKEMLGAAVPGFDLFTKK